MNNGTIQSWRDKHKKGPSNSCTKRDPLTVWKEQQVPPTTHDGNACATQEEPHMHPRHEWLKARRGPREQLFRRRLVGTRKMSRAQIYRVNLMWRIRKNMPKPVAEQEFIWVLISSMMFRIFPTMIINHGFPASTPTIPFTYAYPQCFVKYAHKGKVNVCAYGLTLIATREGKWVDIIDSPAWTEEWQ